MPSSLQVKQASISGVELDAQYGAVSSVSHVRAGSCITKNTPKQTRKIL